MTLLEQTSPASSAAPNLAILKTERLVLRPARVADAGAVAALLNDRRVAENLTRVPHPYTLADAESFLASIENSDEFAFAITRGGVLIGICGITLNGGRPAEIGYWLGVDHWHRGYATEATQALVDHAFCEFGCAALQSGARVSNPASRRVLEKCGFQWTGVGLYRIRAIASAAPVDRFRLDRGIWASLKGWGKPRALAASNA